MPRMPYFLGGPRLKVETWQTSIATAEHPTLQLLNIKQEHKTTTGAQIHVQSILCMKSLLSAREHIIRSGDALYLQSALSKNID